jgi:hypothetical protein
MRKQHPALARDVVEFELSGHPGNQPDVSREVHGVNPASFPLLAQTGEPDLS